MQSGLQFVRDSLAALSGNSRVEAASLFPGVELFELSLAGDVLAMRHPPQADVLQIHYCRAGQAVWSMDGGAQLYLNPGNFSLHTMNACTDSRIAFPTGGYQGLLLCLDGQELADNPPEVLAEAGLFQPPLREKFCPGGAPAFFAGNDQAEAIFSGFSGHPAHLKRPYQRVKALELLLYLAGMDPAQPGRLAAYPPEQLEIVRAVHGQLLEHLDQRITIEALSRQYLINPTTLKAAFKAVYGASLAAHIREHRMELAARLLRESDQSVAEIARAVGYDSQSRFTAAFKAVFGVLPREYRRRP